MPEDTESRAREEDTSAVARAEAIARRVVVTVIGGTLLVIGAILLVVPGPGVLAISLGLGVLALEFAWARRWLRRIERRLSRAVSFDSEPTRR